MRTGVSRGRKATATYLGLALGLVSGVAVVLDLLIVAPLLVMVDDLVMPAGLLIVLDFVVTLVAGV